MHAVYITPAVFSASQHLYRVSSLRTKHCASPAKHAAKRVCSSDFGLDLYARIWKVQDNMLDVMQQAAELQCCV